MSTSSSSPSSVELTPTQSYKHEHPIITYAQWKKSVTRAQRQAQSDANEYVSYVNEFTMEPPRKMNYTLFREKSAATCSCYMYKRVKTCPHVLTDEGKAQFKELLLQQGGKAARGALHGGVNEQIDDVMENLFIEGVRLANISPEGIFVKCDNCAAVLRTVSRDQIPRHTCSKAHRFKYNMRSNFRYLLPFTTNRGERIILDEMCVLLHYCDLHMLDPLISDVNQELERLKLKTTMLQLCLQDPKFLDLVAALDAYDQYLRMGVYATYLYIKFRLLPYLRSLDVTIHERKLIPVFTMITSQEDEANEHLLGYKPEERRAEIMAEVPNEIREEVTSLLTVLEGPETSPDDDYVYNRVCDEISRVETTEKGQYVVKILNTNKISYPALKLLAQARMKEGRPGWNANIVSQWMHMYSTEAYSPLDSVTNIFNIIPSRSYSIPLYKTIKYVGLYGPPWYRTAWNFGTISRFLWRSSIGRAITFDLT